jgi:hypothetical protein
VNEKAMSSIYSLEARALKEVKEGMCGNKGTKDA